jgi:hypothetical protein
MRVVSQKVFAKTGTIATILQSTDLRLPEILGSDHPCRAIIVERDQRTVTTIELLHPRAVTLLVSTELLLASPSQIRSKLTKTIHMDASTTFRLSLIFHTGQELVEEARQEAMVDHKLYQVDSMDDSPVLRLTVHLLQIELPQPAHQVGDGGAVLSRITDLLLLLVHLTALKAESEMLARVCHLPLQLMQHLLEFTRNVLLKSALKPVVRYLLHRQVHHLIAMATTMVVSQCLEPTPLTEIQTRGSDKRLEVMQDLR